MQKTFTLLNKNSCIFKKKCIFAVQLEKSFRISNYMVVIAQLVRASVCGTEGRGFEPHSPPREVSIS